MIVWHGAGVGDANGVFLQRFDAVRNPVGGETRLDQVTRSWQNYAAIGIDDAGNFVVAWQSYRTGLAMEVVAQRFTADGSPLGDPIAVNTTRASSQQRPSIAMDASGQFVIAWMTFDQDGSQWNIVSRRFAADGRPLSGEVLVNELRAGQQVDPSVAVWPGGQYLVTWSSQAEDGSGWQARGSVIDAGESSPTGEFALVTTRGSAGPSDQQPSDQQHVHVARLDDTRALFAWSGLGPEDPNGVYLGVNRLPQVAGCSFGEGFQDWVLRRWDGRSLQGQPIDVRGCPLQMAESAAFLTTLESEFLVPQSPGALQFTLGDIELDMTDPAAIRDALEVALLDADGNSLVAPFAAGRDALWNTTEGVATAIGPSVSWDGSTATVGLPGIPPGTPARLVFRLVNNDTDQGTVAEIADVRWVADAERAEPAAAVGGPPVDPASPAAAALPAVADPSVPTQDPLRIDVTPSLAVEYARTSFDQQQDLLHVQLAVRNVGLDAIAFPVHVELTALSDPTVTHRMPVLEPGSPPFEPASPPFEPASPGQERPALEPGEFRGPVDLVFYSPGRRGFDYELTFWSPAWLPPEFFSVPATEAIINREYAYDADARSPHGGAVAVRLLEGPAGMQIDPLTGQIRWTPAADDAGQHRIRLVAEDAEGRTAEQRYTLTVIWPPANRPPIVTSGPPLSVTVGSQYAYPVSAWDPDGDPLDWSLLQAPLGPDGLDDGTTLRWTPSAEQVGSHEVLLEVSDGRGGFDSQHFQITVSDEPGNHAPRFISQPVTDVLVPTGLNPPQGDVFPASLQVALDPGESVPQQVSLVLPPDHATASSADIVFVVDESSSMATEHDWLAEVVHSLDAALEAAGIRNNRYGLLGYTFMARILAAGDDPFMTSTEFATATEQLSTNMFGWEDGYYAIDYTLDHFNFRPEAAASIVLVTDEDRYDAHRSLTAESVISRLTDTGVAWHLVGNAYLEDETGQSAVAVDSDGTAFIADLASDSYTQTAGGHFVGSEPVPGGDTEQIFEHYVELVWQLGGMTFDLNQLRAGGQIAELYSEMFADQLSREALEQFSLTLEASDPAVLENVTGVLDGITAGSTATFDIRLNASGDSRTGRVVVRAAHDRGRARLAARGDQPGLFLRQPGFGCRRRSAGLPVARRAGWDARRSGDRNADLAAARRAVCPADGHTRSRRRPRRIRPAAVHAHAPIGGRVG